MSDVTDSVEAVYKSLRQVLDDINKLGRDFGQALREEKLDLTDFQEYSYSPNALVLKKNHSWSYSRPPDESSTGPRKSLTFAACLVYFEPDRGRWKVGPPGRPELWFFMGTVTPPPSANLASTIPTFFDDGEQPHYDQKPILGGRPLFYQDAADREWKAVCLGYELGDIDSVGALKSKAVRPLVAEAVKRELIR